MAFGAYALSIILFSISVVIIKRQNEYNQLAIKKSVNETYDYIVIGAGSAGSVVASRLSEDIGVSVLLIEAGGPETIVTSMPSQSESLQGSFFDWNYTTVKQSNSCFGLEEQLLNWPRGKMLGGTSSFNRMVYLRGNPKDFDEWEKSGAKGWSWKSVLKYFKKSENNTDPDAIKNGYHGDKGPVTISTPKDVHPLIRQWVTASVEAGYPSIDLNQDRGRGTAITQRYVKNGVRVSSSSAFLNPIYQKRPNLNIFANSMATKIIFKRKRAVAVEFVQNNQTKKVNANQEIILSAGTINSAQLLMLSGVGLKSDLNKLKIKCVVDLPVGRNLHDHPRTFGVHFLMNATIPSKAITDETLKKYFLDGEGPLAQSDYAATRIQTSQADGSDWPDIQLGITLSGPAANPASGVRTRIKKEVWDKFYGRYQNTSQFSISVALVRPKSRGTITLKSSDPKDYPLIDPNYFSNQTDVKAMVEGVREAYKISLSKAMAQFNVEPYKTVVPGCEQLHDGNFDSPPDDYFECMIKTLTSSAAHQVGTCKMGARNDTTAVVDERLRVRGVSSLRVIDASVMPQVVSANTNAAVVMIAELGAEMVKQDRTSR